MRSHRDGEQAERAEQRKREARWQKITTASQSIDSRRLLFVYGPAIRFNYERSMEATVRIDFIVEDPRCERILEKYCSIFRPDFACLRMRRFVNERQSFFEGRTFLNWKRGLRIVGVGCVCKSTFFTIYNYFLLFLFLCQHWNLCTLSYESGFLRELCC